MLKFYFIVMATPFSFVLFIYKDNPQKFDYLALPSTISTYTSLVGFLGILMSLIIINSRLYSTLYARTVNGIRKYFKDLEKGVCDGTNVDKYFVLGEDVNKPKFRKLEGDITILTLFMALVNSVYIALGFSQIVYVKEYYIKCFSQNSVGFFIFSALFTIHWFIYYRNSEQKEKGYKK